MKFTELGLSPGTLSSIQALGFETPTPIQAQAIPFLLRESRDLIGLASTGTGKTAAFGLPLLEQVDDTLTAIQAVVLAPTRELGVQIAEDMKRFAKHRPNLKIAAVYGGGKYRHPNQSVKEWCPNCGSHAWAPSRFN